MVYCSSCGTANRDGSRFCNECSAKLPSSTGVRCSKCGTANPLANVFCDKCGTRLVPALAEDASMPEPEPPVAPIKKGLSLPTKPAATGSMTPIEPSPAASQPERAPDWLSQLRTASASASDEENEAAVPSNQSDGTQSPDWLARLSNSTSVPAAVPEKPATPVGDMPDWTRDTASEDQPEWLQRIAGYSSAEGKDQSPAATSAEDTLIAPQSQPAAPVDELPDWLSNLGVVAPSQLDRSEPEPAAPADVPDWLSNLGVVASTPTPGATPAPAATPKDQTAQPRGTRAPSVSTPPQEAAEEPDWAAATSLPGAQSAASEDVPAWLRDMSAPPLTDETATPEPTEAPDWLKNLGPTAAVARDEPDWPSAIDVPSESQAAQPAEAEVPDWLKNLGAAAPPPVAEPTASENMPDWLRGMRASADAQPVAPEAEAPDWLNDLGSSTLAAAAQPVAPKEEEKPAVPGQESAEEAAIPDWLRELSSGTLPSIQPAAPEVESSALPDWLSDAAAPQAKDAQAEPAIAIPDWLNELAPAGTPAVPPTAARVEAAQPAPAGELPEWARNLGKSAVPARTGKDETLAAVASAGLTQAEIPAWLEALRPTEGETAEAAEPQEAETEGVFAGISQVLPPAAIMGEVQGAPAKLFIETRAEDLARAGIFQELLTRATSAPTPIVALPKRGARIRQRALQWFIAVLLIGAILVPSILPQGLGFLPKADNLPETLLPKSPLKQMTSLTSKSTVLVVFDYDPLQAGELDQIAEVFLRQLRKQNVTVKVASLNPLGPALADRAWHKLDAGYQSSDQQFINLGYIPGQSIGAQNLLDQYGAQIDLVIDLAASPDSVRWWAEQVAVTQINKPLIVGVSAAAQTLTLPYADSGQIKGFVSGVVGALAYAKQANLLPNVSSNEKQVVQNQVHLDAQNLAQWLLAILIGVGIISGVVSRTGRRSS